MGSNCPDGEIGSFGCMPIFWGFKNENLHSVKGIRSLGIFQSTGEARMRIFIQVFGSGGWVYANLLGKQELESSFRHLGQEVGCMPIFRGIILGWG